MDRCQNCGKRILSNQKGNLEKKSIIIIVFDNSVPFISKETNRYNLPINSKFYRVKIQQIYIWNQQEIQRFVENQQCKNPMKQIN